MREEIQRAATAIAAADAILIGAGVGMGVDSGCPIFVATKVFGAPIRRFAANRFPKSRPALVS